MPIYEYMCKSCNDVQEVLVPYEQVSPCECGGTMQRAYLSPPSINIEFKKDYVTQSIGKNGKKGRLSSKHQMKEWGKTNGVTFEKD